MRCELILTAIDVVKHNTTVSNNIHFDLVSIIDSCVVAHQFAIGTNDSRGARRQEEPRVSYQHYTATGSLYSPEAREVNTTSIHRSSSRRVHTDFNRLLLTSQGN